jgi:hypothetical protein
LDPAFPSTDSRTAQYAAKSQRSMHISGLINKAESLLAQRDLNTQNKLNTYQAPKVISTTQALSHLKQTSLTVGKL